MICYQKDKDLLKLIYQLETNDGGGVSVSVSVSGGNNEKRKTNSNPSMISEILYSDVLNICRRRLIARTEDDFGVLLRELLDQKVVTLKEDERRARYIQLHIPRHILVERVISSV